MTMLEAPQGDAGSSLAEAVFGRLKSDILLGVLAAGSRLRFLLRLPPAAELTTISP